MTNTHFANDNKFDGESNEDNVGYQCRHCDAKFPGLSDVKRHLDEVHEIKTSLSMHYLNKWVFSFTFVLV
jgi:hypothetical protein